MNAFSYLIGYNESLCRRILCQRPLKSRVDGIDGLSSHAALA
jgi:hypothetical protein